MRIFFLFDSGAQFETGCLVALYYTDNPNPNLWVLEFRFKNDGIVIGMDAYERSGVCFFLRVHHYHLPS